jgi:hypothetical protein
MSRCEGCTHNDKSDSEERLVMSTYSKPRHWAKNTPTHSLRASMIDSQFLGVNSCAIS